MKPGLVRAPEGRTTSMRILGQYEIVEPIHGGHEHILYQGHRVEDGAPVVIKRSRSNPQTPRDLARLQHEYTLLREL
ncbi:MAG: hypothetical protein ACMG6S_14790, partial [Byssovorax sp.]